MTPIIFDKSIKSFNLSDHFDVKEFHCRCAHEDCKDTVIDMSLVDLLEEIRRLLSDANGHDFKLFIVSGYRCKKHNDEIPDSSPNSQHLLGKAVDVIVPNQLHRLVSTFVGDRGGVGFYEDRLHIDVRGKRARWGKEP